MHINYISVLLRSVGNLPGTCWKLFGKPVISEEKIQPEEPNGGKHSAVSFLFCSMRGEGAGFFTSPPGHTMWGDGITLPLEGPPPTYHPMLKSRMHRSTGGVDPAD